MVSSKIMKPGLFHIPHLGCGIDNSVHTYGEKGFSVRTCFSIRYIDSEMGNGHDLTPLTLNFQGIITLILATDMARHTEIIEAFRSKLDCFNFTNDEHLNCVSKILVFPRKHVSYHRPRHGFLFQGPYSIYYPRSCENVFIQ